ncbi:hypothetical protein CC77DRAFT_940848 [Alternaria alternata]|uniref:Uncharacterized protein n=1 Tax=Alternaria alternata TaxID=5599 RepID=A0A177DGI4_ALTAL|nr:hypothetical protein CC77DRAFT_940848 [Alternaria alternata]OAG18300.1 hypothetical protein CC77DRAFT_940848 [Alternaria alternata]
MASHGKVLDLFDDRYLELQDVIGNVEPLPTLVPYEQYKQHAIVYRMDTNHDIFMALLQEFTERKSLETGKELWTWCVQWQVDETATRQPAVAPHSPKKPRRGAPPITAQVRRIDPELMHQEDMLRILVDIVQVNSTVVPNFIEFLYRWIDFYEGDGKALNAALYGEIPSLWDFEYHPILVPEDVKKKLDEANSITRDGKEYGTGIKTPKHANAEELAQNSPTKKMRQKPDLATFERKLEESERLQYHEVHFGIQPPKLNEPLPPLINIPRDRVKRAKYHAACFKSRQRALYLLMEAGVTPQQLKDYKRCQTMSLKDTPSREGAHGLENYEKDANLAQMIHSAKEKQRVKQMEIAISNKLAHEAQLAGHSTISAGSSGVPLIPIMPPTIHSLDIAGQISREIQQTKDERNQKINIVPVPLVAKMKSLLFKGAMDRAALLEICGPDGRLASPPSSVDTDGHGSKNEDEGNGSTDGDSNDDISASGDGLCTLPRPVLPPVSTLPLPNLPPPSPSYPRPSVLIASRSSNITVPPPPGFEHDGPFISGNMPPPLGPPPPPPAAYPSTKPQSDTYSSNLPQRIQTSPSYPVGSEFSTPAPPPNFAQRLLALGHATSLHQGLRNTGPTLLREPDMSAPNSPGSQYRSAQERQQCSRTLSLLDFPCSLPPHASMQRITPSPLTLRPPPSPLSSLAPSLLATSPFTTSHNGIPVQIFLPRILIPSNTIGPGGMKLGNSGCAETDAFLLGYTHPISGKITLSRAVFLPLGVWINAQDRVRKGKYKVLESYIAPKRDTSVSHRAVYERVRQAYDLMKTGSPAAREWELTKRWRASRGRMKETQRGAVWEGWAVDVDREIAMSKEDRTGAFVQDALIDGIDEDSEEVRRRKEIDELLETDEAWDYGEDEDVHMHG